jgi:hypothetical protein
LTLGQNVTNYYSELLKIKGYNSTHEESDYLEEGDFNDSSEDNFSVYTIPEVHSDDEYPSYLVCVMQAERTLKKSTAAREEIFDGVHLPPVNKELYKFEGNV